MKAPTANTSAAPDDRGAPTLRPAPRPTIVWFRSDLRLEDNPALRAACERGGAVLPVYLSPDVDAGGDGPAARWAPGGASRVWLELSLGRLDEALRARGSQLVLRGRPAETALDALLALIAETGAEAVVWNRRYEPAAVARDTAVKAALRARGVDVHTFNAALLFEPWTIKTKAERPFQVFTPFWRACLAASEPELPMPAPARLVSPDDWPASLTLDALALGAEVAWAAGIRAAWTPGEAAARARVDALVSAGVDGYGRRRDRPDLSGTTRLSPHLHFGEIGPRQLWHALRMRESTERKPATIDRVTKRPARVAGDDEALYLRELGWREFAHHLLFHFPDTIERPLRPAFEAFPWSSSREDLRSWQRGRTGYPLVDAGMRELWSTGFMHNRVRMVVASFLVKDLLLPWQQGARWFWDTLVDADLAQNTLGWQWAAGCGADAAPYFRIFNPVTQGRRFDPDGTYVRRWVPELAGLAGAAVHAPWEVPAPELARAGVVLGKTYPERLVDHAWARERALAALASTRDPVGR